jgi:hypothetical protein
MTDKTDKSGYFETELQMSKNWWNSLDRKWHENWDVNIGLREMWNGCEMLVAKGYGKLIEDLGI